MKSKVSLVAAIVVVLILGGVLALILPARVRGWYVEGATARQAACLRRQAAPPARLTYQGHLLDAAGNPIADGTYTMAFGLWDAATDGAQVWGPEEQEVTTQDGFFAVVLGATTPLDAASLTAPLYLEIAVEGETLTPRQELASVAFALVSSEAEHASTADAMPWSGLTGVPAGFADGTDDVDDTVSWSEVSAIVGTGADQVAVGNHAHTGVYAPANHDHDDRYATEAELGTSGQASVHWGNLVGVPDGFADGTDDAGGALFGPGNPPADNALVTLDEAGDVGTHASATIGADGLPIISYYDATNGNLNAAHCEDAACTTVTTATLDSTGDVGLYTSIALGVDGLAVIAYYDNSNGDLKVAHCEDAACTSATIFVVDSGSNTGQYTAAAIGVDGLPLIAYYDVTNTNLKVAHCNDLICASAALYTLDGAGIDAGQYAALACGADGLGLVAYFDATNNDLKVAHCANAACSTAAVYTLDSVGTQGRFASLAVGTDGLGLIAYRDATAADLKVAHCASVACATATISTLDDTASDACQFTSLAIGADGLGLVSYRAPTGEELRVAHCTDLACTGAVLSTVDDSIPVSQATSVTIGADGLPLIVYYGSGDLRAARCANPFCSPYFHRR